MADVIENDSKSEVHAVIRFLQAGGVSQSEIHAWQVSECLRAEGFQPKGSVCEVQQT
jgi:hypothetical protein